jgi:hypothetical protein
MKAFLLVFRRVLSNSDLTFDFASPFVILKQDPPMKAGVDNHNNSR